MKRSDLIERLAARFPQLRGDAVQVVHMIHDAMVGALNKGNRIEIRQFGVFQLNYRAPRRAHNPRTGQAVTVPAKLVPHFRPAIFARG